MADAEELFPYAVILLGSPPKYFIFSLIHLNAITMSFIPMFPAQLGKSKFKNPANKSPLLLVNHLKSYFRARKWITKNVEAIVNGNEHDIVVDDKIWNSEIVRGSRAPRHAPAVDCDDHGFRRFDLARRLMRKIWSEITIIDILLYIFWILSAGDVPLGWIHSDINSLRRRPQPCRKSPCACNRFLVFWHFEFLAIFRLVRVAEKFR